MEKTYKGVNGQITISNNIVVISRKGALGFLTQGLKGDKRIPIKNITAVQYKDAGFLTNGYIQLSIHGSMENKSGLFAATHDENTVMFNKSQSKDFLELRDSIESVIAN
jgi:hypothetical protein